MKTRSGVRWMFALVAAAAGMADGDVVWDGGGGDGYWTNAVNWSGDILPIASDSVFVTNGATVNLAGLQPSGNLPQACTVTVSGASTLTVNPSPVRLNGSTLYVSTGILAGGFWDLSNGKIHFENGAAATMTDWELKGSNTFGFKLGATGFSTLLPGRLRSGIGGGVTARWSTVTFNMDVSAYQVSNGASVVLVDFASHDNIFTNAFNPVINLVTNPAGPAAALSFDTAQSKLILTFDTPPPIKTWDGGGADNAWTTAANWNPDGVPVAGDTVAVGAGASVTNGQNAFSSLMIEAGAAVKFAAYTAAGNVITNAGTLNFDGVYRLTGAPTVTLTGSGRLGSAITWLDTQGAWLNFRDGAAIDNGNMAFELRNNTQLGFTLSESGFATLDFGQIWDGGTAWSNITIHLDLSSYNWSNGTTLVLADFNAHTAPLGGLFDPTVNITATNGLGATLSFDTVNSSLVLTIDPPGNDPPVANSRTVSVYSGTPTNVTLTGTDVEGSNLTFTVLTQPTNGLLTGTAPNLTYTPTNAPFLFDSFTFTAFYGAAGSNTGMVKLAFIPYTDNELWATYHPAILSDPLNTEWLTNWVEDGISIAQVRYDLGPMTGSRTNAEPRIAGFYAYPVGGTNLPGMVEIHGGGQVASAALAKYWAQRGYATISINWGARPLLAGLPNTDWDGLPEGFGPEFGRVGVTNAIFHEWHEPDAYDDGATLYDVNHPMNSSWTLNSYAARRALTFLTEQPVVITGKLGVVGWSMGGHTTVLAATDPRLTAVSPGVGGTGFLYEDWWGLPGTARSTNGVDDVALYTRTVDCQSFWPDITCALHFLEGANDFNAPFDLVTKAMALQPTNAPQVLAFAPHMNHFVDDAAYASRVMWMKDHLLGTFDFPRRAEAELVIHPSNGIPSLRIWPDLTTTNPLVRVDAFYSIMRNSLTRYWRNAAAVFTNGYWEAPCPAYERDEMFVALGVVYYDTGAAIPLPAGYSSTSRYISVASEVITIYPPGLATNGVQETAVKERAIDDFTRGWTDWWYKSSNPEWWEFYTRKLGDPSWAGPLGGELAFDVTTTATGSWLGIQVQTMDWNATTNNTYSTVVHLPAAGTAALSLPASAFTNGGGAVLTTWTNVTLFGFLAGNRIHTNLPAWTGANPVLGNLRWSGGAYRPGEEFARAMAEQGLRGDHAATDADPEGDGAANLFEYAAGSSATNGGQSALFPTFGNRTTSGFQGLEYVYRRRLDAAARGLTYAVQATSNLVAGAWSTNGTQEVGAGTVDAEFESVTNRIFGADVLHGRLRVDLAE